MMLVAWCRSPIDGSVPKYLAVASKVKKSGMPSVFLFTCNLHFQVPATHRVFFLTVRIDRNPSVFDL